MNFPPLIYLSVSRTAPSKGNQQLAWWTGNHMIAMTATSSKPTEVGFLPSPRPEVRGQRMYDAVIVAAQNVAATARAAVSGERLASSHL